MHCVKHVLDYDADSDCPCCILEQKVATLEEVIASVATGLDSPMAPGYVKEGVRVLREAVLNQVSTTRSTK